MPLGPSRSLRRSGNVPLPRTRVSSRGSRSLGRITAGRNSANRGPRSGAAYPAIRGLGKRHEPGMSAGWIKFGDMPDETSASCVEPKTDQLARDHQGTEVRDGLKSGVWIQSRHAWRARYEIALEGSVVIKTKVPSSSRLTFEAG
jgi:hypothetical protein